jgi:transposase
MQTLDMIGIDLAKNVFQLHGASQTGAVLFQKKLSRGKLLSFLATQPTCTVAMEACASAHYWGRQISTLGHRVRLIAPNYVKPFVQRQKNDAADAQAICEAAQRPTMRFVAVTSEEKQASTMVFKARDLLVRQRNQVINALRGHLTEFGIIAPQGARNIHTLIAAVDDQATGLPEVARSICQMLIAALGELNQKICELDREIMQRARQDEGIRRLMTIPGVGPITATALEALAPAAETFAKGRDFAAWMGLTPKQNSSGGKPRLGKTSKMGQRDLRRLLIIGATAVVRWAARHGTAPQSWLGRMLRCKPPMLIAVALANKMARIAWALMARGGVYRASGAAV